MATFHGERRVNTAIVGVTAALSLGTAGAQFGGGGFGGYSPPAPICKAFSCKAGEKAVGKPDSTIVSYGCKDTGMNILSMGKDFDPNNPYASMNQAGKNLNKCCIERDICKQTCGMSSKECHDTFQKCQTKVCKGDQNCQLQAMISDIGSDPYDNKDDEPYDKDKKYDPEETKCRGYSKAQEAVCQCAPKDEVKAANEKKLKAFYAKFNPEKLDDSGEIKDVEEVWKKWKGKEPSMFMALAMKYKDKAVQIKEKPKPKPYTPPPADMESESEEQASPEPAEEAHSPPEDTAADVEAENFEKELKELTTKKQKAKEDEDFDLAQEMKEKVDDLKAKELERLKVKKTEALTNEDYMEAKKIKARIAKLEL